MPVLPFSTPLTRHLVEPQFDSVYQPAEDSFLFLDAFQQDWNAIVELKPAICLEVGCGSGIISTFVSQNLQPESECFSLCIDINPAALSATHGTFEANRVRGSAVLDTVLGDLTSSLLPVCSSLIDLILFNPPYVVTSSEELHTGDLTSKAWAGGENGREVIDRFFPQAARLLSRNGIMYCVALQENNIESLSVMAAGHGLDMDVILTRRCRNELLHILRFKRKAPKIDEV